MSWELLIFLSMFVLLMCYVPSNDDLDYRYFFLSAAMCLIVLAEVYSPWMWKIALAITAAVIIYFSERHYARLWDHPRLWWYRFLQDSK